MAEKKVEKNTSEARKAYGIAMSQLRELNAEQFATLLDEAYASLGLQSPRVRREERAAEAAAKKAAAAIRREERRLAKIEALKAELAALAPGDPLF